MFKDAKRKRVKKKKGKRKEEKRYPMRFGPRYGVGPSSVWRLHTLSKTLKKILYSKKEEEKRKKKKKRKRKKKKKKKEERKQKEKRKKKGEIYTIHLPLYLELGEPKLQTFDLKQGGEPPDRNAIGRRFGVKVLHWPLLLLYVFILFCYCFY